MEMRSDIAARAHACIGVRFRPHGRDPAYGLDCVGLAGIAYDCADLPRDYALRGGDAAAIAGMLAVRGLVPVDPERAGEGDLLLLVAGPAQYHLAVLTARGFVHADAGLRRVVEVPGRPCWPVVGAWRAGAEN
jgi:lipoprotein Spr